MNKIVNIPPPPTRKPKSDEQSARELADLLHSEMCRWNHADGCSWYYFGWDNPCSIRKSYLEKAYKLMQLGDIGLIQSVIRAL